MISGEVFAIEKPYGAPYKFILECEAQDKDLPTQEERDEIIDTIYALTGEVLGLYSVEELEYFPTLGGEHTVFITSHVQQFTFLNGTHDANPEVYFHVDHYYNGNVTRYPQVSSSIKREIPSPYEFSPHKVQHSVRKDRRSGEVTQAYHIELGTELGGNKSQIRMYLNSDEEDMIVISGKNLRTTLEEIDQVFPELRINELLAAITKRGTQIGGSDIFEQRIPLRGSLIENTAIITEKLKHFIATGEMLP